MSIEFNIGVDKKWFLGDDKILSFTIFGSDGITPIDFSSWQIEFVARKKTKPTSDLAFPIKSVSNGGLNLTGTYNADPLVNTQRLIVPVSSLETTSLKAGWPYRYSIKRTDSTNEEVLVYGSITFLQAPGTP